MSQILNFITLSASCQFPSVNCAVVTRLRKNFEQLFIPSQATQGDWECWCKQPTSKSFQMCLYRIDFLKLYNKSTIIMLANILTKIWSKISKNRLIFWMVCTCNRKRLEEVKKLGRNECILHRWPRSLEMSDYIRPYQ